ncbi:YigZ family protein [Fusibacter sp. JL298sf-3]
MGYKTVYEAGEDVIVIEKSRFIGYVTPVASEEEATAFIEKIKKKHWDATHNVPVYVIGENYGVQRYSDDGEPSGTAGVPVLEMLKKEGITNVCLVMTRYFGGIKLGTGGLVRAYTQTAKIALEAGGVVTKALYNVLQVTVAYHYHGKLQNELLNADGVIVHDTAYTEAVTVTLYVEPEATETLKTQLTEWTSGNVVINENDPLYLTIKNGKVYSK